MKKWYIWLSLLGFAIIWGDTVRRFKFASKRPLDMIKNPKRLNLWLVFIVQTFKWVFISVMIPMFIVVIVIEAILQNYPELQSFLEVFQVIILYLLGVYITNKNVVWREHNLNDI